MDTGIVIVLGIVILLVIGINGALFMAMRRGKEIQQINLWRQALGRARDPFEHENRDLAELSRRVRELESQENESPPGT
jgi:hypothetical protein